MVAPAFAIQKAPSWAIPTRVVDPSVELHAAEYQPVFLDMALSVVAANRLDIYRRRGEPLAYRHLPDGMGRRVVGCR